MTRLPEDLDRGGFRHGGGGTSSARPCAVSRLTGSWSAIRRLKPNPTPLVLLLVLCAAASAIAGPPAADVREVVKNYCIECHNPEDRKGEVDLKSILADDLNRHSETWLTAVDMLYFREMPPEEAPQPSEEEYKHVIAALEASLEAPDSTTEPGTFAEMVDSHCVRCHNAEDMEGELNLNAIRTQPIAEHSVTWEKALRKLNARVMPPLNERRRPSEAEYQVMTAHLVTNLDAFAAEHPRPGRTPTFRRLNRTEYQNAIRDLLAVEVDVTDLLPADESSHGFDNITVGNLPPALMTRYLRAAEKIARLAVGTPRQGPDTKVYRVKADVTQEWHVPGLPLGTRGGKPISHHFPRDGEYEIQVRLMRDRNEEIEGLHGEHELEVLLGRERVAGFEVAPKEGPGEFDDSKLKARFEAAAGPQKVGVTFVNNGRSLLETKRKPYNVHYNHHRHPRLTPAIYQVSITGPYNDAGISSTPSRRRIFTTYPDNSAEEESAARQIVRNLMRRAYRRPVTEDELAGPMRFYHAGREEGGFEAGIERALTAILVSPRFLFRIERDPEGLEPGEPYTISNFELASRLSFFLWSSIPDEKLLAAAESGELRQPDMLEKHVRRMLADERASALATNFAGQWLHLRNLDSKTPNARRYPDFGENLRRAMRRETELHVERMISEDRSVLDLIRANYTYLNERLARHYGIPHVQGSRFRRVDLPEGSDRGGLLRHGSILTVTSYATRTSPVVRGNWILENILGTPAPPPPEDVPSLDQSASSEDLTVRQRLAKHRADPACASCHDLMDPVGFALENFDAVGRWRELDAGRPVDASGGLPGGDDFEGVAGLEAGVLERPDLFVTTLTEKLMTFGLGRGVRPEDAPAIRRIVRQAAENDYRFSSIILGIVRSEPFQMRTAK